METTINLLNNKIKISTELNGKLNGLKKSNWGADKSQHHTINVTHDNHTIAFDFWASKAQPYVRTAQDLLDAFQCLLSDAGYGRNIYEDFCNDLGYDIYDDEGNINSNSKNIHSQCSKLYKKFNLLNFECDVHDMYNELCDKYNIL